MSIIGTTELRSTDRREMGGAQKPSEVKERKHEEILVVENAQLKPLLETRRQKLQDAQRFMGTVNAFAESEVVQEDTTLGAGDEVIRALGRHFLAVLKSTDTRGETILLEIATQVAATNFLAQIISTWTNDSESDNTLTSVYERIRKSENQSVAGQWRALTRKFAQAKHVDAQQLDDSCNRERIKL
ncbi:uncharacterized protein B0H18DRAFT_962743 [Fomitopsis serialis]|uniref:uncharacterized protein n=1 Tax=Fomitopsis serialis TaxID=139415 RepID=UPI002008797E|nr:uncharacterized protein B0H18DRAFT_962743 [Neoantrodia serialis]KAH9910867.1 hypothetical protein B0H18DRAFT_962743 [Neoantrodia serialis]